MTLYYNTRDVLYRFCLLDPRCLLSWNVLVTDVKLDRLSSIISVTQSRGKTIVECFLEVKLTTRKTLSGKIGPAVNNL